MVRYLGRYFLRGLLVVVPLGLTTYVFFSVLNWVDGLLQFEQFARYNFPGLGLLLTLLLITVSGALASNFLAQQALEIIEGWVGRLPLIKLVYNSLRDLTDAFVGDKKSFDQPVWFAENEASQVKRLGFVTRQSLEPLGLDDHVAIYMPLSYTFGGFLVAVPRSSVHAVDLDSGSMMALIVSGGISRGQTAVHGQPKA